jgi:hypothetical protein
MALIFVKFLTITLFDKSGEMVNALSVLELTLTKATLLVLYVLQKEERWERVLNHKLYIPFPKNLSVFSF